MIVKAPLPSAAPPSAPAPSAPTRLEQAGEAFEAMFVSMMLKSARQASLAEGLFDSNATRTYRDMQDTQLAQIMASRSVLGFGDAVVRAVEPQLRKDRP